MEKALRYELNKIAEIKNKIYPTNAPEGEGPPYLVYIQSSFKQEKTLKGFNNGVEVSYLLNIMAPSYESMKNLTKKVKDTVISFLQKEIGVDGIFIEDLRIDNVTDVYENELKLYRGIIDITFWYKE